MELQIMYPPQKDSPTTFLLGAITTTDTFAVVGNAGLLPKTVPFPLTLGPDRPITETVMVTSVDLGNNRITFERGLAALPWDGGTTVGRVFNAQDLKTVQDNIITVNAEASGTSETVAAMAETIQDIETTVGGPDSGLVKGLADEITRAKTAESAETQRAMTAEGTLENKKINRSELPQIITDASYSADATKLTTTLTRYNASNKETSNYDRFIPLITTDSVGLMTPEAYNEITALRTDVMALQQQGGRFIGISFDTKAALDGYVVPESVKLGDFTYVLDDEEHEDSTTRYIYNGTEFEFAFVVNYDPVGIATDEIAGLVKSSDGTIVGKVFVEADGTMSVVGWTELNAELEGVKNGLDDRVSKSGDIMDGQLIVDNNVSLLQPESISGAWGREFRVRDSQNSTNLFSMGAYGTGTEFVKGYIGKGYNSPHLEFYENVTRSTKSFEETLSGVYPISTQTQFDNYVNTVSNAIPVGTLYKKYVGMNAAIPIPMGMGGTWLLEGHKVTDAYETQKLSGYGADLFYYRVKNNGYWQPWGRIVTDKPIPWIYATLEGGITGQFRYRRNSINQLEVNIAINAKGNSSGARVTVLPVGFRPHTDYIIPLLDAGITPQIQTHMILGQSGNVYINTARTTLPDGIIFGSGVTLIL